MTFIILLHYYPTVCAQAVMSENSNTKNWTIYFAFGTNRSFYSNSDITLKSAGDPAYNFTMYNVRGKDDGGLRFDKGAPQYSYQLGYYNNKKGWGIEFNFDHIKYYIRQFQRVPMRGNINNTYFDTDTLLNPDFVQLEHTDGGIILY